MQPAKGVSLEQLDTNLIAQAILKHASESRKEEDLKIRVESTLRPIFEGWGVQWASYERGLKISGREDALYGHVIIEYKTPQRLAIKAEFTKAKQQVEDYISQEANDEETRGRYFGVILDGYQISFVRFRKGEWDEQAEPLPVNGQTILRLLESIRGLRRKPIDADFLLLDFGPRSETSKKVILALYESLADKNTPRTDMLFDDWKRVFSQVCSYSKDKFTGLADYYSVKKEVDVEKLLFAIHTYYTILMKLLTSEIVTLFADSLLGSYLKRVEEAYYRSHQEMLQELKDLEEGGIFATVGIKNFLEADYFGWYLDEWNETIAKSFFELTTKLLDYEPATVELNPERVKDLFKRLYQNLVPRDIRHSIGEYFTPDWLAELLLDEVGYDGNSDKRVLDPACGSGTFLVLTIKRIREYADDHFLDRRTLIKKIVDNVHGIDLNPLAVLASKANYLIALSDLIRYRPREGIEIPIYLADSISVVRKATPYGEDEFELQTNEGKFWIAKEVIDKNLLDPVLSLISECTRVNLTKEQFEQSLSKSIPLTEPSVKSFIRLYDKILKLESYGKDRIWTSLLKNSFSPMLIGKFDYVVGNPPWINWENLPEFYRDSTKTLWDNYGLLEKTKGVGLGKAKKDISMLFVARCFDQYVNDKGSLAFLIPFTMYKTQAGAGFRNWLATQCSVKKIHDLVELYPFEGAVNRTSLIITTPGRTNFPVPAVMWHNPKSTGADMGAELDEVKDATNQFDLVIAPITVGRPETSWMMVGKKAFDVLQKVMRPSTYKASAGIFTALNGAYWVKILSDEGEDFLVQNLSTIGKKKVRTITTSVESAVVFPLARGQDHKKWYVKPQNYIILPVDSSGEFLSDSDLKMKFPKVYKYFLNFFDDLVRRGGEPYKTKLAPYLKEKSIDKAKTNAPPFYWLFNIGLSLSPYKVVWKEIAGKISG